MIYSILDLLTIDILEVWIKKSVFCMTRNTLTTRMPTREKKSRPLNNNHGIWADFYVTCTGKYYCMNMKYLYYRYICLWKKKLNCSLAIDSRFQTFAVGLLVKFIRLALPLLSPEILSSLSKLRIFLFNVHLALFV